MFKNYLLSTLRNILKNPLFSLINIGGLAVGLMVCILVYLYVDREFHYDAWVDNPDSLYRVEERFSFPEWGEGWMSSVQVPLHVEIQENFPEINHSSLFDHLYTTVKKDNVVFYEQLAEVDEDFFDMFSVVYVEGNRESVMPNQNSIILTQSLATKYFGDESPLGKMITIAGDRDMMVSAVIEDFPSETHMKVDGFVQYRYGLHPYQSEWSSNSPWLYVQVNDPSLIPNIHEKFAQLVAEHKPFMSEDEENPNDHLEITLQPFSDVHLISNGRTASNPYGNLAYVYGYIGIAALILMISCINYVNLSTARATKRTKEVCMRKIMGASRKQLTGQFMGETLVLAVIALIAAILLTYASIPWFEAVVGGSLNLNLFSNANLWVLFLALLGFTGLTAGLYPALIVSRFRPSHFLHANKSEAGASSVLRNLLVIMQFAIATALIAAVSVIYSQM